MTQISKNEVHPLANSCATTFYCWIILSFFRFFFITLPIMFQWLLSDAARESETLSASSTRVSQTCLLWATCVASPSGPACLKNPSGHSVLAMLDAPIRNTDVYIKVICAVYQMAVIWWQVERCIKWRGTDSHAPPPCWKVFLSAKGQWQTG